MVAMILVPVQQVEVWGQDIAGRGVLEGLEAGAKGGGSRQGIRQDALQLH